MNTHQWLDELQEYLFPAKIETLNKISRRRRRFGWSESLELRTLLAAPVSVNDSYNATSGQTLFVPASGVLANDSDADEDPLSAQLVTPPMIGTLTFNTDGSFSYAAPTGFMGNASFVYRAYDGTSYSTQSTVTLTVSMGGGGGIKLQWPELMRYLWSGIHRALDFAFCGMIRTQKRPLSP